MLADIGDVEGCQIAVSCADLVLNDTHGEYQVCAVQGLILVKVA